MTIIDFASRRAIRPALPLYEPPPIDWAQRILDIRLESLRTYKRDGYAKKQVERWGHQAVQFACEAVPIFRGATPPPAALIMYKHGLSYLTVIETVLSVAAIAAAREWGQQ